MIAMHGYYGTFTDVEQLAALLRRAADAHHAYEIELGHADTDWPTWYAKFMLTDGQSTDNTNTEEIG